MATIDPNEWFTEVHGSAGSAFSVKIRSKRAEVQTAFQTIVIYETETFGNLMVIDGCTMLSDRDHFLYHEMMAHPALYTHPDPRQVAIIGGGDCGLLREVLKHPEVEQVWQIEIDEAVTRLAEQFFPELCEANIDPRAHFQFEDGIAWIAAAEPESLDLIFIDSTDPIGPAEGLFEEPFYRDCFKALRSGGILVLQSESPFYHESILKSIYACLQTVGFSEIKTLHFPQIIYPSGWWSATMGVKQGSLDQLRESSVLHKPFSTRYYTLDTHKAALALPPFLADALP